MVIIGVGLALAAWGIARRVWVQDDAFIAFRYARNLVEHGQLSYNLGERVEGYTDFLWVLLIAAAMRAGADPIDAAKVMGIVAFVAMFLVVAAFVHDVLAGGHRARAVDAAPLTVAGLLSLNTSCVGYATGGLETSLFAFLAISSLWLAIFPPRRHALFWQTASVVAMGLTRPDGALIYACILGFSFVVGERILVRHGPTWIALGVYAAWKIWYFGSLLPNTFYAKSAGQPFLSRGAGYVATFLLDYPYTVAMVAAAAACVGMGVWDRLRGARRTPAMNLALPAAAFLAWLAYVAWVGGDFMEFKPIMHAWPIGVVTLGGAWALVAGRAPRFAWIVPAVVAPTLAWSMWHEPVYPPRTLSIPELARQVNGTQRWAAIGRELGKELPPDTVIATTAAGAIPYFSDLPTLDMHGLTDAHVAHGPITPHWGSRGLIGHEKDAGDAYLRQRGVNLVVGAPELVDAPRSPSPDDEVYLCMPSGRFLRMRWLVQTPALAAWFADKPDVFTVVPAEVLSPDDLPLPLRKLRTPWSSGPFPGTL